MVRILQRMKAMRATGEAGRSRWPLAAKAVVTIALLGLLVWQIDVPASLRAIGEAKGGWLLLALASTWIMVLTSVLKWASLVRDLQLPVSTPSLARFYLVGVFASSFLPGIVGGDVVRWQLTARHTGRSMESAATIIAERAAGVAAMIMCAVAAMAIQPRLATLPVLVLVLGMAAALTGGIALALY
ncbi:MAG: lysylphosphatidylglycerol synthase domain-containing protein, partial [Gemmatimonadota bacterium]